MNVKILATGSVETVNSCYGMRLIEQGKAVLAPEEPKEIKEPAKSKKPEQAKETVMPDGAV